MGTQAEEAFRAKAPQALRIQKVFRGLKGRRRFRHWKATQGLLSSLARAVRQRSTRLCFRRWKGELAAGRAKDQLRRDRALKIQVSSGCKRLAGF